MDLRRALSALFRRQAEPAAVVAPVAVPCALRQLHRHDFFIGLVFASMLDGVKFEPSVFCIGVGVERSSSAPVANGWRDCPRCEPVFGAIASAVRHGSLVSDEMNRYPAFFAAYDVATVRLAEYCTLRREPPPPHPHLSTLPWSWEASAFVEIANRSARGDAHGADLRADSGGAAA